jgi:hypothetical protein
METLIYAGVALVAVLFAIHRGHSVSLGLHVGPRKRRK